MAANTWALTSEVIYENIIDTASHPESIGIYHIRNYKISGVSYLVQLIRGTLNVRDSITVIQSWPTSLWDIPNADKYIVLWLATEQYRFARTRVLTTGMDKLHEEMDGVIEEYDNRLTQTKDA